MCFDTTESEPGPQSLQFQVRPRPSCVVYLVEFRVYVRPLICVYEIWKRLWVIRETILLQECAHSSWTCVRNEGRNSLVAQGRQISEDRSYWCIPHNRLTKKRIEPLFWTRRKTSVVNVSRMSKDMVSLDVYVTWRSVVWSPNRGCENTFCCLTPDLLTVGMHFCSLSFVPSSPPSPSSFLTKHFGLKVLCLL